MYVITKSNMYNTCKSLTTASRPPALLSETVLLSDLHIFKQNCAVHTHVLLCFYIKSFLILFSLLC